MNKSRPEKSAFPDDFLLILPLRGHGGILPAKRIKSTPPAAKAAGGCASQADYQPATLVAIRSTNSAAATHMTGWICLILPEHTFRITQNSMPNMMPLAIE